MNSGWEKELQRVIQPAMQEIAADYQKMFASLSRRYKGRPVSEIKPVLRREWARVGGSISDPELTAYATHINEGTRIQMRIK
jgi:hypothetical protein